MGIENLGTNESILKYYGNRTQCGTEDEQEFDLDYHNNAGDEFNPYGLADEEDLDEIDVIQDKFNPEEEEDYDLIFNSMFNSNEQFNPEEYCDFNDTYCDFDDAEEIYKKNNEVGKISMEPQKNYYDLVLQRYKIIDTGNDDISTDLVNEFVKFVNENNLKNIDYESEQGVAYYIIDGEQYSFHMADYHNKEKIEWDGKKRENIDWESIMENFWARYYPKIIYDYDYFYNGAEKFVKNYKGYEKFEAKAYIDVINGGFACFYNLSPDRYGFERSDHKDWYFRSKYSKYYKHLSKIVNDCKIENKKLIINGEQQTTFDSYFNSCEGKNSIFFSALMVDCFNKRLKDIIKFDYIVYVPPTESGDLVRDLAMKVGKKLNIEVLDNFIGGKPEKAQKNAWQINLDHNVENLIKQHIGVHKMRFKRFDNVYNVYKINNQNINLNNKSILLLDDFEVDATVTTEIAKVLRENFSINKIYTLVLGRDLYLINQ